MYKIGDIVYCGRELGAVSESTTIGTHVVIMVIPLKTINYKHQDVFINICWRGSGQPRLVYNNEWIRHVR